MSTLNRLVVVGMVVGVLGILLWGGRVMYVCVWSGDDVRVCMWSGDDVRVCEEW